MKLYSIILQGSEATEAYALEFAKGFDFSSEPINEVNIPYMGYIDTVNGIDIYYNYGTDTYHFGVD